MIKKLRKKGFTIVELVIVIAVIAILAAILIPTFSSVVSKANASKVQAELKNGYTLYLAGVSDDKEYDPELGLAFEYTNDKGESSVYLYDGSVFTLKEIEAAAFALAFELASYNTEEKWTGTGDPSDQNTYVIPDPVVIGDYIFKYAKFDNVTVYKAK